MDSSSTSVDIETINAYGSLIVEQSNNSEENSSTSSEETDKTVTEREYCSCKGKCFRKKGKGVCKCRADGLFCHERCLCRKTACKNQDETTGKVNTAEVNPDGEEEFQQRLRISQGEIENFVSALPNEDKDKILINLLNMGRGSLDFARSLIAPESEKPNENQQDWCKCGVCTPMPTPEENICCKKARCISCYTAFSTICLDRDVLEVVIKARCDIRADDFDFGMESFRKAGYRQYALWKYGKLGRGNRRVLPACVVRRIRERYPSPTGQYMGYRNA